MNSKTFSRLILTGVTLAGFSMQASANDNPSLHEAIRAQLVEARHNIAMDSRATVKAMPLIIDNPAVDVGPVEVIAEGDAVKAAQPEEKTIAAADLSLRLDLLNKALMAPGMFGVYRFMTETAVDAITVIAD